MGCAGGVVWGGVREVCGWGGGCEGCVIRMVGESYYGRGTWFPLLGNVFSLAVVGFSLDDLLGWPSQDTMRYLSYLEKGNIA